VHPKRLLGFVGVIVAGTILITSAGAGTSAIPKVDLSTKTGVAKYLKSIGVNPKGVVIQRGLRNYAGPSCPGARWHCTRAKHVFQIAAAGGENKFECPGNTAESEGIDQDCVITQSNTNGNNEATCREELSDDPMAVQSCDITQVNTNGDNKARVDQKIKQKDGTPQSATQMSEIDQTNVAGKNDAKVDQKIDQNAHVAGSLQNADQSSCVKQHDPADSQNACTDAVPGGTAVGDDKSDVHQDVNQDAHAGNSTDAVNQMSNIDGHVSQDTAGKSMNHNHQDEHQKAEAKNAFVNQSGPMHCCTVQGTNPGDKFDIDQHSDQKTNADFFVQDEEMVGTCLTTGLCHVDEDVKQNGAHQRNSCDSPDCVIGIVCTSEVTEGPFNECTPCTGESCSPCTECECEICLTTFSLRATAHQAARPQALKLMRRSALLH